jgi:phospholipid/cholesterol/gamma-HCH transport system ATP-binding protein
MAAFPAPIPSRVSSDALVEVESVDFSYGRRPILKGVSMRIPRGKVVAIMGGSGCGKTTLLRVISGQLRPTAGTVKIAGEQVHGLDAEGLYALRRRMSMLFQFGALFTDLTVFENVAFPLREHTALPERLVRDLVLLKLEAVGLRGAHHLMPSELSGGMARRVALARAVVLDPMLVLYDEPFAGLDPISLSVIGNLVRKLNDALGATSIVVSHDVVESLHIVDYVYFMAEGRIVAHGTPAEMRATSDPLVRQFIHGETEGPVPFHVPTRGYADDVGLSRLAGGAT